MNGKILLVDGSETALFMEQPMGEKGAPYETLAASDGEKELSPGAGGSPETPPTVSI
jgi:hypothetical protein